MGRVGHYLCDSLTLMIRVIGKPSKKGSHEARAQEAAAKGGKAFKL